MKNSIPQLIHKWFYIFPLLTAIYPIIFLYSNNVQELVLSQLTIPVVLAVTITLFCYVSLAFWVKDTLKAGIITTIFILVFFLYGLLFDWLVSLNLFTVKHRHIFPIVLFISVYIGYFVYLIKKSEFLINGAKIFAIIVTALLVINMINIVKFEIKKIEYSNDNSYSSEKNSLKYSPLINASGYYPDIYYIVLDEYASSSTIKGVWGFDNSEFEDHLRSQGFYITNNSRTHMADTLFSTASTLNMEYINESDTLTLFSKINDNLVMQYLKKRNYTIVLFDGVKTSYEHKGNISADIEFIFDEKNDLKEKNFLYRNAFDNLLIGKTILKYIPSKVGEYRNLIKNRNEITFEFEKLRSVNLISSPKFVYFHITIPHPPFVFTDKGDYVDLQNQQNWQDKQYYLGQYIYTNNQLESAVDEILSKSKNPPVIIIQSDHGPRNEYRPFPDEETEMPHEEKFKIFNAYYLPNNTKTAPFDNISSVNTFRFIFNQTFHDDIELLAGV